MQEEFTDLNTEDQLRAENEFLKMKLMLERGGYFGGEDNEEIPPEVENQFLSNILAFEKQFDEHRTIKVFDKIGRPEHFQPVSGIAEEDITRAWKELDDYMLKHGIGLDACSPRVSARELYRFATEELFDREINDINIPGLSTNFIYDDFYPDPVYENSMLVEQDLFGDIFSGRKLLYDIHYANDGFSFNDSPYDFAGFSEMINRFKSGFDEIGLRSFTINSCEVKDDHCQVRGVYQAAAKGNEEEWEGSGTFRVELIAVDSRYWYFKSIFIEGFQPAK